MADFREVAVALALVLIEREEVVGKNCAHREKLLVQRSVSLHGQEQALADALQAWSHAPQRAAAVRQVSRWPTKPHGSAASQYLYLFICGLLSLFFCRVTIHHFETL